MQNKLDFHETRLLFDALICFHLSSFLSLFSLVQCMADNSKFYFLFHLTYFNSILLLNKKKKKTRKLFTKTEYMMKNEKE